jgi:CheY-like chemotaxis protein
VESGAALTKQLLGFARGGKYEVRTTDLNDLVTKTAQMFGRTKKEINIHNFGLKSIWNVEVDQSQIEQVLLNLFVNAWHAMPGGGDLYLETENATIDETFLKPYRVDPGAYVRLSVADTGVGMDIATQERIFEPFFTTKEVGKGTGLGLASAYGIIKNHNGIIRVYSEDGNGTTFNIYLPASDDKAAIDLKVNRKLMKGQEKILLVDDEAGTIQVEELMLKELGYKVLAAMSGHEAVQLYKNNMVDLVALDMIMPEMNGKDTYEALKKINPAVKVLLVSGYSLNKQIEELMDRGCNGFIQKPFDIVQLSQKIREVLEN